MLIQITMPHFCAGLIVKDGRIINAAPILKWTIGKTVTRVKLYYNKKNAKWKTIK